MLTLPALALAALLETPVNALPDLRQVLQLPLSPGAAALLAPHLDDPDARTRLRAALLDPSPDVRGVAARVVNAMAAAAFQDTLLTALETEGDTSAAVEQLRAAVALGVPPNDPRLLIAIKRLGRAAGDTLVEAMAWRLGPELFGHAAFLAELGVADELGRMLEVATQGDSRKLTRTGELVLRSGDPDLWRRLLEAARSWGTDPDAAMLAAAVGSGDAKVRAATYLHLVARGAGRLPDAIAAALDACQEATAPFDGSDVAFAFELAQRARGRAPRATDAWAARTRTLEDQAPLQQWRGVMHRLTAEERAALVGGPARRLGLDGRGKPLSPAKALEKWAAEASSAKAEAGKDAPAVRSVSDLPSGLVDDLLRLRGCRPPDRSLGGAQIVYAASGRPRDLRLLQSGLDEACSSAAAAALPLSLASRQVPTRPGRPEIVLLMLDPEHRGCPVALRREKLVDVQTPGAEVVPPARPRLQDPKKTRNVAPLYPAGAKNSGLQGVVVLEAVIDSTGCIQEVWVEKHVHPLLDVAAIQAVTGWRYTPTLLEGKPVPVLMTVTVNFRLR